MPAVPSLTWHRARLLASCGASVVFAALTLLGCGSTTTPEPDAASVDASEDDGASDDASDGSSDDASDGATACPETHYAASGMCTPLTVCDASQFESTPPTATSDRICTALTVCTASQFESTPPTTTSDRACTPLTVCTTGEFESTPPTATSDRVCMAVGACGASAYEAQPPTPTMNRVCVPYTLCTATQFQTTAPTPTSDRVCASLATCTAAEWESAPPTAISNRACTTLTTCTSLQYETAAATPTSDRMCATTRVCTASEYETVAPTPTSDRVCASLRVCVASEYESAPPTATSNRACAPLTVCTASEYESAPPTATSNRTCAPVRVCTAAEYETAAPTATSNRICAPLRVCTATEYETAAPTATSNRTCAPVRVCTATEYETAAPTATSNRACAPLRVCAATEYETAAPSATSNRMCALLTVCSGTEYESTPPTTTSNRACSPLTVCSGTEYESTPPTPTSNRACSPVSTCTAAEYETLAPTPTSDRQCALISTCPAGSRQTAAPTPTSDRQCTPCVGGFSTTTNAATCTPWSNCAPGSYVSTTPSTTNDRACTGCAMGTYASTMNVLMCTPWSVCGSGFQEFAPGTVTSNRVCIDIDECQTANGGCSAAATCANTLGSRTCTCKVGYAGDGVTCAAVCGDTIVVSGVETCDDGNTTSGDGCSDLCVLENTPETEPNNTCAEADGPAAIPPMVLFSGNVGGVFAPNPDWVSFTLATTSDVTLETFDATGPGHCASDLDPTLTIYRADCTTVVVPTQSGGGISSCAKISPATTPGARQLPPGTYMVRVSASFFGGNYTLRINTNSSCGNGLVEGYEMCEGGATCAADCSLIPECGNARRDPGEACDDGNTDGFDGCSGMCQWETFVEGEPNGTTAQADFNAALSSVLLIDGNRNLTGAISPSLDKDVFRVSVAANDTVVRFETFDASGNECVGLADMRLTLLDALGATLTNDVATNGIGACASLAVLLQPGTYYIQAEKSTTGTIPVYFLSARFQTDGGAEIETNDTFGAATMLPGTTTHILGDHQTIADADWYRVIVPWGASIRAEIIEGSAAETCQSNGIDSTLTLYDALGTELGSDGDNGRGLCSVIDGTGATPVNAFAHFLRGSTYYLRVTSRDTMALPRNQFDYRLVVDIRSP